jgi:hypothetical protein
MIYLPVTEEPKGHDIAFILYSWVPISIIHLFKWVFKGPGSCLV